jgi:hypothetical protein
MALISAWTFEQLYPSFGFHIIKEKNHSLNNALQRIITTHIRKKHSSTIELLTFNGFHNTKQ